MGATIPDFWFLCVQSSLLFLLHRLHLLLQRCNIRMNLLYRRLKSLRQCKTNQPVVSGKSEKKVISLKVYRRASRKFYNPTNACFSDFSPPPIIITASYFSEKKRPVHACYCNRTVVDWPSVCMMQRNADATQRPAKSPKNKCMHLDSHALVQLINRISTDIDILGEQLVRHLVFLQDIVVGPRAREGGTEQEAEHSAAR